MKSIGEKKMDKVTTLQAVLRHITNGCTLMIGGFGGVGNPPSVIDGILKKGVKDLTLIGNDTAFPDIGVGRLVSQGRVKKVIASHIGSNPIAGQLMSEGKMEVEFCPQGTLAERIRAGGVGLGGIITDIGLGTVVEENKQKIRIEDQEYLVETALTAEVSIVYAKKADRFGNLIYDKSARNMNPLVGMAGTYTIAEVEEIVPTGQLDPESIVTPGTFVDAVVPSEGVNWKWPWE